MAASPNEGQGPDIMGVRRTHDGPTGRVAYYSLAGLRERGVDLSRLPFTVKILLENLLRHADGALVSADDVLALARWNPAAGAPNGVFPFMPARVVLQDFTGVPAVVDLAMMRAAVARLGGDPARVNPLVRTDLVIDHSVQVDVFGSTMALARNVDYEYARNGERYALLRWAQQAFDGFQVVPPGTGIIHQVNLEYLATVVHSRESEGVTTIYPDTLVGTDSHTTMINGLGVLGWGVGGIEAEAVLLGQPMELVTPEVIGFKFSGELREGVTGTDLVLTVTQMLRQKGVVGKFVEYFGAGLSQLTLADRATLANMAPEYGATAGLFPIDEETLRYLRLTGRNEELVQLVEWYAKEQDFFRTDASPDPIFTDALELDLATVEPSLAGPRRPQDRVPLGEMRGNFRDAFAQYYEQGPGQQPVSAAVVPGKTPAPGARTVLSNPAATTVDVTMRQGQQEAQQVSLGHGSVVIAAITSCTNTSNPTVMIGAGLLAKKAVEKGLSVSPTVKTSLAPGSKVVTEYYNKAGLTQYLDQLGFNLVGYGCTTCIGNSGPLPEVVEEAIQDKGLAAVAVLSGNRNFEGRIHPLVRAQYLASPPLVVAYALAGTVDIDLTSEPLGMGSDGQPVYLRDIWPTSAEIRDTIAEAVTPEIFAQQYAGVFEGDERWRALPVPEGNLYEWDASSTYVQEPPFLKDLTPEPTEPTDIQGARALGAFGHSVTTDHISPAGSIPKDSPAGQYLIEHGVPRADFNSYGARRGNHQVMIRGTFGNVRLKNALVPDREGDWTIHQPDNTVMRIYDASMQYQAEGTPLVVLAGTEYGTGSSRDWAAKGTRLLGVQAVLAQSFERIHRTNLVGMGVLPLQFLPGESATTHNLDGHEIFDIIGIAGQLRPNMQVTVRAHEADGSIHEFQMLARLDTPLDVLYYRHGGIMPYVTRLLLKER